MSGLKKSLLQFLLLQCFIVHSQTFNFKNHNTEQGLPQSQVLCIFQDHRGYMWFGTNSGGAARFNGNTFNTFNTNKGLIDNNVFSIVENSDNELLFATSKGLSVYNGLNIKNFNEKEGLKSQIIYSLLKDENKTWLGTEQGVYVYEKGKIKSFLNDTVLNQCTIYAMFRDKKGNVWFGTIQQGIVCYEKTTGKIKHFRLLGQTDFNVIFSMAQLGNGDVLVSSQKGLFRINNKEEISEVQDIPFWNNVSYTALLTNENNQLYYGTQTEGVKLFDFDSKKRLASFKRDNGLTNAPIQALYKDKEGNLWIGTDGAGVYKYSSNKFIYYNKLNGFSENYVTAVSVDGENNIWAGLKNAGISKISNGSVQSFVVDIKKPNELTDNNITAILPIENGKILVGTVQGLCLYENGKFRTIKEKNFEQLYITALYQDKNKTTWIGTSEGLFKMTDNKPVMVEELKKYKKDGQQFPVYFITEDKTGKIWIGSNSTIYSLTGNSITPYTDENKSTGYIYSGVVDHMDNIWLGTDAGVFLFKNKKFISISKKYNYTSSFINFLQPDKEKKLYVGSNNGIDIIDLNEFYQEKFACKHLGKDDGLLSVESNFNASAIDKNGNVMVGTINGLEIYNPHLDKINEKEARINILDVKLFYGEQNINQYSNGTDSVSLLPKKLTLPFNKNNLTFQFVGISFIAPEKVMYQYKLEGIDNEWTPPVYKTEITYPSLPAGTYTFVVKAANSDGVWNKEPAKFTFTILPPWYNTWWFYTACVITLAGSVLFYNYYRTAKLKADKLHLENIVSIRTKELRDEKEKVESINKEVVAQKQEIEHKSTEITDSIKYAKNIQEALLPSLIETEKSFKNCFVLYQPKDIVSGDFFWYAQKDNLQYIAAADCTGHGVPGAFMSIVGNTLLNEIVNEKNSSKPGDILLELHKSVKGALNNKRTDSERRDGMDIALCCINKNSNTIEYAGANRPLWIFRKQKEYELEVVKPTKHPIGGLELEEHREYQNNSIEIFEGDCLYIFSDGFADQFGGPKGKKFMISNMQKLLASNIQLSMNEQKSKIKEAFNAWKDELEQVDDVLVIGIRF